MGRRIRRIKRSIGFRSVGVAGAVCPKGGLVPGSVINAGANCGAEYLPNMGWFGLGFAGYIAGLVVFNRIFVKYKKAKASKEVDTQQDAIKALATKIKNRHPDFSDEKNFSLAHKHLEDAWLKNYNEKQKRFKVVNGEIFNNIGSSDSPKWIKI